MNSKPNKPTTIDEYIATFPGEIQIRLEKIRATIRKAAPEAKETISYQMPAFLQNGILVFFAAWKDHISFYPTASGIEQFKNELSGYEISKGTLKFPLDKPIPLTLIRRIVLYRVKENKKRVESKRKK